MGKMVFPHDPAKICRLNEFELREVEGGADPNPEAPEFLVYGGEEIFGRYRRMAASESVFALAA
jgi:hypothetical protein